MFSLKPYAYFKDLCQLVLDSSAFQHCFNITKIFFILQVIALPQK